MALPSADLSGLGNFPTFPLNVPPPSSGGMFGGGGDWRGAIVAALAGFLSRRNPALASNALEQLQLPRQMQYAQQQKQAELQGQYALHQAERSYDNANLPPDDLTRRIQALSGINPGDDSLGAQYARQYAAQGGSAGPVIVNPLTGQTMVPAAKAQIPTPPADAVARLKANPSEASQFDEIFGPGSSAKVLGGPSSSGSGGFL